MLYLKNSLVNLTIILFSLLFLSISSSADDNFIFPKKKIITIKTEEKKQNKVEKNKIKYVILTTATKLSGLGHFSRSKTIFREINEAITADVRIICLGKKLHDNEFLYNNRIQFINKIDSSLFKTNNKIIIDLPQNIFKDISNKLINNKN